MKLYCETLRVFSKYKVLWLILMAFNIINISLIIRTSFYIFGEWVTLLEYTRQVLMLSPQFLVLYLIVGYEFFSEPYRNNTGECILGTDKGSQNKNMTANLAVMVSVLFINFLIITIFTLAVTLLDMKAHGIQDIDYQCTGYIVESLFVNIFMISTIGLLVGLLLARIKKRVVAYAVIMTVAFATSYLLKELAMMVMRLSEFAINLHSALDILNIMSPGLDFTVNNALGFPLMTYRICLIAFWISLLLTLFFVIYEKGRKAIKVSICVVLCMVTFAGYALPSSRIDMSMNKEGSAMADQHYYDRGNYHMEETDAGFDVEKYTMYLDVKRLLKAKVTMEVSQYLDKYKFTLSHSYHVERVYDEYGNAMEFCRDKDTLLVCNNDTETKKFTIEYTGDDGTYYANSQGINLRGSFPYYPLAGYRKISDDGFVMYPLFLQKKADFDIEIKSRKKIHTNLTEDKRGHLIGKSNGATLLSGMYASVEKDGIEIIYPYLNGWTDKELNVIFSAARKENFSHCKIFITPAMNKDDNAISEEQIITNGYFESIKEDLEYQ